MTSNLRALKVATNQCGIAPDSAVAGRLIACAEARALLDEMAAGAGPGGADGTCLPSPRDQWRATRR